MQWLTVLSVVVLVGAFQAGCAKGNLIERGDTSISERQAFFPQQPVEILAGTWEYQDDATAYALTLDERGNGSYERKDGDLITTSFSKEDRSADDQGGERPPSYLD